MCIFPWFCLCICVIFVYTIKLSICVFVFEPKLYLTIVSVWLFVCICIYYCLCFFTIFFYFSTYYIYTSTHCIWHLILSTVIIIFLHSFVYYIVKCLFLESLVSSLLVDSFILFSVRFYLLVWTNGSSSKTNTRNIRW